MVYLWVLQVPRVSHDTVNLMVQFLPVPGTGTVCSGTGTVSKNLTHGLPMRNPIDWLVVFGDPLHKMGTITMNI